MIKAIYPSTLVCAGEEFCVGLENCPPGFSVEAMISENPQGLAPPQFLGYADGIATFQAIQAGPFAITFICCPPE